MALLANAAWHLVYNSLQMCKSSTLTGDVGGHLDVLSSIPSQCKTAILSHSSEMKFRKGSVVWNQGDHANFVAFLIEGAAMSTFHSTSGRMGVTGIWFPGDILGAADLGASRRRQLTLKCIAETRIYSVPTTSFFRLISRFPDLSKAVIKALSIRLRWVAHLAISLETQSAFGCVCTVLLSLSERFSVSTADGTALNLNLTNEDLASFVGVTRQRMNVILRDLQNLGVMKIRRRKIFILDPKKLEALIYHG